MKIVRKPHSLTQKSREIYFSAITKFGHSWTNDRNSLCGKNLISWQKKQSLEWNSNRAGSSYTARGVQNLRLRKKKTLRTIAWKSEMSNFHGVNRCFCKNPCGAEIEKFSVFFSKNASLTICGCKLFIVWLKFGLQNVEILFPNFGSKIKIVHCNRVLNFLFRKKLIMIGTETWNFTREF